MNGKKGHWPFKSPEKSLQQRERGLQQPEVVGEIDNNGSLPLWLTSVIRSSN